MATLTSGPTLVPVLAGISRDRLVDLALGLVVTVVVAVPIAFDVGGSRAPDAVAYVFALGLGALMLVRREYPVLALAATAVGIIGYYLADYPPFGMALPIAAALYSAAEQSKLRWAIGISAALVVISTVGRLREGDDPQALFLFELTSTVAIMAAAIILGDNVRMRKLWRADQERRERELAEEREREAASRIESERVRIARDLHDILAHTVAVVSLQADVATEALADDPRATRNALGAIRTASGEAMRELRTMLGVLRKGPDADPLEPAGSLRHLDKLVQLTAESGLQVDVRAEGTPRPLPALVDTTAFRIAQEALTNVLRHAEARQVEVRLTYHADRLEISVTDDGRGGDGTSGGQGLVGMRERAGLLGGTVVVQPAGSLSTPPCPWGSHDDPRRHRRRPAADSCWTPRVAGTFRRHRGGSRSGRR